MISKSYLIIIGLGIALGIIIYFIIFFAKEIFTTSLQYIPTILGAIGTSYGLYAGISKQISAKKKNIVIKYDGILKIKPPGYAELYNMLYLLRIKKTKGESIAKFVRGYITIEGTEIQNIPLRWYMQKSPSNNINDFKDLWLFSTQYYPSDLSFLTVSHSSDSLPDRMFSQTAKDMMKRKVTVRIESDNAKVPNQPFIDTVENIISNARDIK